MTTQDTREALATCIADTMQWEEFVSPDVIEPSTDCYRIADAILAANILTPSPRVVTTVDELEALPEDSVIRDARDYVWDFWGEEGWYCAGNDRWGKEKIVLPATVLSPAPQVVTAEQVDLDAALGRFVASFNGDEAGDISDVWASDGAAGFVMTGGNDVRAVFMKAVAALSVSAPKTEGVES